MSEITSEDTNPAAWRAEYAYTAGVQAFIYGFPYIYNARVRHDWVTKERDPEVVPVRGGQPPLARCTTP